MAGKIKSQTAAKAAAEPVWAYGIRTWDKGGKSYGGFEWDLTIGARTTCPDFEAKPRCGNGLHANEDGWGDWSLLGLDADGAGKVLGIVRWDAALTVRIDEAKSKAPWMEVVMTSESAALASIYGFISQRWQERAKLERCEQSATGDSGHASATGDSGHASATGYSGHASATGDSGHASATGYRGHASATGYSGHASATGYSGHASATGYSGHASATGYSGHASATGYRGHASATGDSGHASATGDRGHASATGYSAIAASLGGGAAKAGKNGAIVLSAWDWRHSKWTLLKVFAGMVGETHGDITIKPGVAYRLQVDGALAEVA